MTSPPNVAGYRIVQQIGAGGMGAVYLAEHVALGRRAAIKVLHQEFSSRPEIVTRFFNEARAATMISDPGIVQIFDFSQQANGFAYIVMELLEGEPLDRRLERSGALPLEQALRIMRQVSTTLGAAHARGIVHRDLKPENIFMVRDAEVSGGERAKILDFGIAKLATNSGVKTNTSAVMGTPMYMSPEQCRGAGEVDQRSDVYALGCVLFALLTGRTPFVADGAGDLIVMHVTQVPPTPSHLRAGLPVAVDQLILRCLAKHPGERFSSAGELATALAALLGSSPDASVALPTQASTVHANPTTLSSIAGESGPVSQPSSTGLKVAGLAALLAIAIGVVVIAQSRSRHETAHATATLVQDAAVVRPVDGNVVAIELGAAPPSAAARATTSMLAAVETFTSWAAAHKGAPCPSPDGLGLAEDPWGHPWRITCTDQPARQMIGLQSNGPDGIADSADDLSSWAIDEVSERLRGPRWHTSSTGSHTPKPSPPPPPTVKPSLGTAIELDANGIPVHR